MVIVFLVFLKDICYCDWTTTSIWIESVQPNTGNNYDWVKIGSSNNGECVDSLGPPCTDIAEAYIYIYCKDGHHDHAYTTAKNPSSKYATVYWKEKLTIDSCDTVEITLWDSDALNGPDELWDFGTIDLSAKPKGQYITIYRDGFNLKMWIYN